MIEQELIEFAERVKTVAVSSKSEVSEARGLERISIIRDSLYEEEDVVSLLIRDIK